MKRVRPLLFLTFRSFINGFKRAMTSPRRLVTLIFFVGYYFLIFIRPAFTGSARMPSSVVGQIQFPPLEVIDSVAFALFSVLSFILMLGVMSYQGGFKPADVDVLFPTPISPKLVLMFRMFRDYLVTLIMPFLIVVLGLRPVKMGWEALFRGMPNPEYSGLAVRFMTVSWILMAMSWIGLSYAVSLFTARSDMRSDLNRKLFIGAILVAAGSLAGFIIYRLSNVNDPAQLIELSRSPVLRSAFFTATFATQLTMAPFHGDLAMGLMGGGGLLALVIGSLYLSFSQSGWLYDQAAVRGFKTSKTKEMQRTGDWMGIMAERARSGKVKTKKDSWVHRLRLSGPWALLWKELLLQPRSMLAMLLLFVVLGVIMSAMPGFILSRSTNAAGKETSIGFLLIMMQASTLFMVTLSISQTGFIELLKRVDLQKPMPFSPSRTVAIEIFAKSLLGALACVLGAVGSMIVEVRLWEFALACIIFSPAMSVLLSSNVLMVTLLFPDLDDPSQRQFRGLLIMLGTFICGLFPALTFALLSFAKVSPPLAALAGSAVASAICFVLIKICGGLYNNFNPAE